MIVLTLARKPPEGIIAENAMKWGISGVNIDATRIGTETRTYKGAGLSTMIAANRTGAIGTIWDGSGKDMVFTVTGRWPANVILSHRLGCQLAGVKQIRSRKDEKPEEDEGREDTSQWRFRPTPSTSRGYAGEDGLEAVEDWACEEGCLVASIEGGASRFFKQVKE